MQHEDIGKKQSGGATDKQEVTGDPPAGLLRGLSGKLLILTIVFVMLAEVLIFVPSVANFRNVWLQNHLDMAEAASIVYLDKADPMLSEEAQRDLLETTGAIAVVINEGAMRQMMASEDMPAEISEHIDLSQMRPVAAIRSALSLLLSRKLEVYRVFGPMKSRQGSIELVQTDRRLKQALRIYSRNVLLLSLAISVITAGLVIFALYRLIIRPIRRLSTNMTAFAHEPDNAALILHPTRRSDEIGTAERRLAAFEADLHNTLRQRQHLAELGLAVSKINHDLRNILASAQLFSDRISKLPDPTVQRLAPKLLRTIDRAVGYTRSVLNYGRAVEASPDYRVHRLYDIVEDAAEVLGLDSEGSIEWRNEVDRDLEVEVDSEQMFRVVVNICRNGVQAMERSGTDLAGAVRRLTISAATNEDIVQLRISDTGPGIPRESRTNLFRPFGGSRSGGGTGLGLAIAEELMRAHGGGIVLEETASSGTVFCLTLPQKQSGRREITIPGESVRPRSGRTGDDA